MKTNLKLINYFLIIIIILFVQNNSSSQNKQIILEDFSQYNNECGIFDKWLLRDENNSTAEKIYTIKSDEDNKFLNANSNRDSIQIAKKTKWNINSFPVISWKWRALKLPDNAKEDVNRKNDSGASIYVIFQRSSIPFLSWKYQPINVIKYVWSTTLPAGKIVHKNKTKAGTIIYEGYFFVLESGEENLGKWITEKRNVLEDYKTVFGEKPKYDPFLIGILTDSNNTKSLAIADYDDFIITPLFSKNPKDL